MRILLVTLLLSSLLAAQDRKPRDHDQMRHLHRDADAYIAMLEDPERDAYQKPHDVIMALELKEGEILADIGAGSGYFSFRLAHHIGTSGRLYAVDINPDMIRHLNRRVREQGQSNITPILADADDPLIPVSQVNRFFICDTWHHVEDRHSYLAKMRSLLAPGGEVVLIDFKKKELPFGPPQEMKLARETVIDEFRAAGFELAGEHKFLEHQYFLIFRSR